MTEREMLRLQGFPDAYKIVCGYAAMRKLTGNSVAVPAVEAVIRSVLNALDSCSAQVPFVMQASFFETYNELPLSLTRVQRPVNDLVGFLVKGGDVNVEWTSLKQ